MTVSQPPSPPLSPRGTGAPLVTSPHQTQADRAVLASAMASGELPSNSIRRASLQLSPSWDSDRHSLRHLGDLDDDDTVRIAFFPKMPHIPDVTVGRRRSSRRGRPDGPSKEGEGQWLQAVSADDDEAEADDDQWSTASVMSAGDEDVDGSVYSEEDRTASGIWQDVPAAAPDAILGIAAAYANCPHAQKVNVCVGAYRDGEGRPHVLNTVRKAERLMTEDPAQNKEYLPIEGDRAFLSCAMRFAYGRDMDVNNHIAVVQSLSGTGALCLGGNFLSKFWPGHEIYVPDPTWGNHIGIFNNCGLKVRKYRYYDRSKNALDLEGMVEDLQRAKDGSIVLLHACAHNPTGCDPTMEEWKEVVSLISSKSHVAFFDSAYQGFASGSAEADAQAFRYAVSQHVPILLAQSFAKNFGLYGERVGTLSVVCGDKTQRDKILSELRAIIRPMYSSPPRHGSSIVRTILSDPALREEYDQECAAMALRIKKMRVRLVQALKEAGSIHNWDHITRQIGMFAFTGMGEEMCRRLTEEYFIFLTTNGRISVAGLNEKNLQYVADAIHAVTDGKSIRSAA